jgi:hypothetical protein
VTTLFFDLNVVVLWGAVQFGIGHHVTGAECAMCRVAVLLQLLILLLLLLILLLLILLLLILRALNFCC